MSEPRFKATDDPRVMLLALRIVEAIRLNDQERLRAALADTTGDAFAVMLSLAAFASDLLGTAESGPEKLQEWLTSLEVDTAAQAATQPPSDGDDG